MWLVSITHTQLFSFWLSSINNSNFIFSLMVECTFPVWPNVERMEKNADFLCILLSSRSCVKQKTVRTLGGEIGRLWQEKWKRSAGCISGWWSWWSIKYMHAVQLPPAGAVKCPVFTQTIKVCDLIQQPICKWSSLVFSLLLNRIKFWICIFVKP